MNLDETDLGKNGGFAAFCRAVKAAYATRFCGQSVRYSVAIGWHCGHGDVADVLFLQPAQLGSDRKPVICPTRAYFQEAVDDVESRLAEAARAERDLLAQRRGGAER